MNFAQILIPLHKLSTTLQNNRRKYINDWTEECENSFQTAKTLLVNATILSHPISNGNLSLTVDASNTGVGAVLEQLHDGKWILRKYFSKKIN